jgi:hypothetical protein
VLVSRFWCEIRDPHRGEVAAFHVRAAAAAACGSDEGTVFLKRIVALPGDRWREQSGYIYVNGERLAEPMWNRNAATPTPSPRRPFRRTSTFSLVTTGPAHVIHAASERCGAAT